jgi:hypothetical protein
MQITAKFSSTCSCCRQPIAAGSKIEWTKGSPAKHVACSQGTAAVIGMQVVKTADMPRRRTAGGGRWNGCSCGAREMPDGSLSRNACASCRFDNE